MDGPNFELPENLTTATMAFSECNNLTARITKMPTKLIGVKDMFKNCYKMKFDITNLPDNPGKWSNLEFKYNSAGTFPITAIPETYTNIASMFQNCSNALLPIKKLPDNLTNLGYTFMRCYKAVSIIPEIPSKVTTMNNTFTECSNMTFNFTELPDNCANMQYTFEKCTQKFKITKLPANIANMKYIFDGCTNLECDLDELVANAPADGWASLTDASCAFRNANKVTGSRSAFLAKCPNLVYSTDMFLNTNTTE